MLKEIVARYLASADMNVVMRLLAEVSQYDRYQASQGINAAADLLAGVAYDIGLTTVRIDRFIADGTPRWWTFKAPTAWTPTVARLSAVLDDEAVFELDLARQPFSLATYSKPTPSDGLAVRFEILREDTPQETLAGAIVLVSKELFRSADLVDRLVSAKAEGFVTDGPCCDTMDGEGAPGRIELGAEAPLFGFSVTSNRLSELRAAVRRGATARVQIDIDRRAPMPVVHAILDGDGESEVLLTAHLCHPRPGANDNASGVAAILGVADAHIRGRRDGTARSQGRLRFQWGPEFLGTVAQLHASLEHNAHPLPSSVINLDMVGEDQQICACPFVLERSPDTIPSRLNDVAEEVVGAVFEATGNYPGVWRSAPFLGYSDHAMYVDPKIARPAIQLCHYPDRFNHSAADTIDKVSVVEMTRATVAAAAIAEIMTDIGERPFAMGHSTVRATGDVAQAAGVDGSGGQGTRALTAVWPGPLNLRAMTEALPSHRRTRLLHAIRADKYNLALLFNLAIRSDGRRTRAAVVQSVSNAMRRPVDPAQAEELINCLLESGWIREI
jgi:hypothetical protein